MAKTRRKKINRSPQRIFKNSRVVVAEEGFGVKVAGFRAEGNQVAAKGDKVKAIHVGRQYTGVPRGKTYPYASKKRRRPLVVEGSEFVLGARRAVMVTE